MRKFSSYGPVNTNLHYYAPRESLVERGFTQLAGEEPEEDGHYITVWAPRQCGKTWIMQQVYHRLLKDERFHVLMISVEYLKIQKDENRIIRAVAEKIAKSLNPKNFFIRSPDDFHTLFLKGVLEKPGMKQAA